MRANLGARYLERSVFSRGPLDSASVRSDYSDVHGSCVCFCGVVLGTCASFTVATAVIWYCLYCRSGFELLGSLSCHGSPTVISVTPCERCQKVGGSINCSTC